MTVFVDPFACTIPDPDHGADEERWVTVREASTGNPYRIGVRVISARLPTAGLLHFAPRDRPAMSCCNIRPCHSGQASRASPGEREPESSKQNGSCIHVGRGLLGPGSREPG
jgi:hypothetical protein